MRSNVYSEERFESGFAIDTLPAMMRRLLSGDALLRTLQLLLLAALLFSQHIAVQPLQHAQRMLPAALKADDVRVLALGEAEIAAKLFGYWLLSFDTDAGEVVPYDALDYDRLIGWLAMIQLLDPRSQDPARLAGGVFIEARDPAKARQMIEFVYRQFKSAPAVNWRWLAYATLQAKYRLGDLPLARQMAHELRITAEKADIPLWARDLELLILQDMGEFDAAVALTSELLQHGAIRDAAELQFLTAKLKELQQQQQSAKQ